MQNSNAVVIGSGVGGMAAAIRLAAAGMKVHVFEKNDFPGGKISSFRLQGFHFDAGPSLFTEPWLLNDLFSLCGERLEDHLSMRRVKKTCSYFFPGGKKVEAWADPNEFAKEMFEKLGEPAENVLRYLSRSKRLYNGAGSIFLNKPLQKAGTWLRFSTAKALFSTPISLLSKPLHDHNARALVTAEAQQLFDRFATYNGSDPYRTPAIMSVIPHLEHNTGTWYPLGGMIVITDALYRLALRMGVRFSFNSPVSRIIHTGGRAKGVVVAGRNYSADIVISNMDVYHTYNKLLNSRKLAEKNASIERSTSALVLYWGINRQFEGLGLHNIFFSADYRGEFRALKENRVADDVTVYVNITAKEDPSHAPEGMENWFVMVNVPPDKGQNWKLITEQVRKAVLRKLEASLGTDVEQHIIAEKVLDPVLIGENTLSYQGALYGTSSNSAMSAFMRQPNYSPIAGLYLCGGSVHPGGGIPLCLRSAAIATDMVKRKHKLETR